MTTNKHEGPPIINDAIELYQESKQLRAPNIVEQGVARTQDFASDISEGGRRVAWGIGGGTIMSLLPVLAPKVAMAHETDRGQSPIPVEVKKDDTLVAIAKQNGTSVEVIIALPENGNLAEHPNLIHPKDQVFVPATTSDLYRFEAGDNPTIVSQKTGIPISQIMDRVKQAGKTQFNIPIGFEVPLTLPVQPSAYVFEQGDNPTTVSQKTGMPLPQIMTMVEQAGKTQFNIPIGFEIPLIQPNSTETVVGKETSAPAAYNPAQITLPTETPSEAIQTTPAATQSAETNVIPQTPPSADFNIPAITEVRKVDAALIQQVVTYLIDEEGFSPQGAAYFVGTLIQESGINPNAVGDHGTAKGVFQARGGRQEGMPEDNVIGQVAFAVDIDMLRDAISVKENVRGILSDPNAPIDDVKHVLQRYERYDDRDRNHDGKPDGEGGRFDYGQQIYDALMTPLTPPPASVDQPAPAPISSPELAVSAQAEQEPSAPEALTAPDLSDPMIDKTSIRTESNGIQTVEVNSIRVNVDIAANLAALLKAANQDGLELTANDSFRTEEDQHDRRVQNSCPDDTSPSSRCKTPTAPVGSSEHEKGHAIDFAHSSTQRTAMFKWLAANAEKFGFFNFPQEPWHWSTSGS